MSKSELIGLSENFGIVAYEAILVAGFRSSGEFDEKVRELVDTFGLVRTPWESSANFLRDEILPIMDMDNELECYMVMYLIHHIGVTATDDYDDPSSWRKYHNEESSTNRIHIRYSGHWEAIIRGLLTLEAVKGKTLERYLRFPENLIKYDPVFQNNRELFAISYSFS